MFSCGSFPFLVSITFPFSPLANDRFSLLSGVETTQQQWRQQFLSAALSCPGSCGTSYPSMLSWWWPANPPSSPSAAPLYFTQQGRSTHGKSNKMLKEAREGRSYFQLGIIRKIFLHGEIDLSRNEKKSFVESRHSKSKWATCVIHNTVNSSFGKKLFQWSSGNPTDFECYDSSKNFWKKDDVLFYLEMMPLLVLLAWGRFRAIYIR